jgi:predicted Zn-dependent protease with MMP-like domain
MSDQADREREEAWDCLGDGHLEAALERAERLLLSDPDDPDATLLCALTLQEMGEAEQALPLARRAVALDPDDLHGRLTLASLLYETCAFEEGLEMTDRILVEQPADPFPHHLRGLLCDMTGRRAEADVSFRKATRLDPENFPPALAIQPARFDDVVGRAVAALPEEFRRPIESVPILVEDVPSRALLETLEHPAPDLLGLFVGIPLTERSTGQVPGPPDVIYLFKRNLERACGDERELVEEIGVTLRHEVGHYLGMDEDDLEEAGHA